VTQRSVGELEGEMKYATEQERHSLKQVLNMLQCTIY